MNDAEQAILNWYEASGQTAIWNAKEALRDIARRLIRNPTVTRRPPTDPHSPRESPHPAFHQLVEHLLFNTPPSLRIPTFIGTARELLWRMREALDADPVLLKSTLTSLNPPHQPPTTPTENELVNVAVKLSRTLNGELYAETFQSVVPFTSRSGLYALANSIGAYAIDLVSNKKRAEPMCARCTSTFSIPFAVARCSFAANHAGDHHSKNLGTWWRDGFETTLSHAGVGAKTLEEAAAPSTEIKGDPGTDHSLAAARAAGEHRDPRTAVKPEPELVRRLLRLRRYVTGEELEYTNKPTELVGIVDAVLEYILDGKLVFETRGGVPIMRVVQTITEQDLRDVRMIANHVIDRTNNHAVKASARRLLDGLLSPSADDSKPG